MTAARCAFCGRAARRDERVRLTLEGTVEKASVTREACGFDCALTFVQGVSDGDVLGAIHHELELAGAPAGLSFAGRVGWLRLARERDAAALDVARRSAAAELLAKRWHRRDSSSSGAPSCARAPIRAGVRAP